MSRRFTFVLIAIILAQFCVIYVWQQQERKEELAVITASMTASHEMAIAGQVSLLEMEIESHKEFMRDDTKARFLPLLDFVTRNYAAYQSFVDGKGEYFLREESIALIKTVFNAYEKMMMAHHASMDLRAEEAILKCSNILEYTVASQAELATISRDLPPALQSDMVRVITLDYIQNILFDAMHVSSGRTLVFDEFFPVFMPDRCAYERGDSLKARVAIGSYSNSLDPANVQLIVDGKELKIGPDGTAEFNAPAGKPGEHSLVTKVAVTNPLTGEINIGEGRFHYRVE